MANRKRITHTFLNVVNLQESRIDRMFILGFLMIGVIYGGWQILQRDWLEFAVFIPIFIAFVVLASSHRLQTYLLGQSMNRRHAVYLAMIWGYNAVLLNVIRFLVDMNPFGKTSGAFYALSLLSIALVIMVLRMVVMVSPFGYRFFITQIPLWEQLLVATHEFIAASLLAYYVGGRILARLIQPDVFTIRLDPTYTVGVAVVLALYYVGMQVLWIQRLNDWLSQNNVWVNLARVLAPVALVVVSMVIWRRFAARAEPRTTDLLGTSGTDLVILAIGAVAWLVIFVLIFLVYSGRRGLRQRFLPDMLLERLPPRISRFMRSISDVDLLLILGLMATLLPAYLFLIGDQTGIVGVISGQILETGSALIETWEQALALLFATPFYVIIVVLLLLYAYVLSRPNVSAVERDDLVEALPVGLMIVLIITLYLFAVPFSQVLTEGRLPQLPQDLGRILAFNILIPLLLLYVHYFLLVRWPYGSGQARWREQHNVRLLRQQDETDRRIINLNHELDQIDRSWHAQPATSPDAPARLETLFRYVQLNSLRDDLNMQRLRIIAERQELTELSEAPVSIAVARLPIRVVSLGIPLLLVIQVYQWAIVNNGLREIINTPNITVDQFFRIILQQANF